MYRRAPMRDGRSKLGVPFRAVLLASAIATVPSLALAGQVKGRVSGAEKLLNPVWNEAKDVSARRFTFREPSPTVKAEFRNLFAFAPKEVCIAAVGTEAPSPSNSPTLVTIGGGRTTPVTIVVAPGTRLKFENRDPFPHRLYAVGQGTFLAADQASMASREWTAPGPGTYEIRDELAPSVRAWVVVEPNVTAIAYPGRDGAFAFAELPPGSYTLKAFFKGEPAGKAQAVQVAAGVMELKEPLQLAEGEKASGEKAPEGEK